MGKSTVINMYEHIPKKYLQNNIYYNSDKEAPQHPARILICGASGTGKSNLAINLILKMKCFDKVYLFAKELNEPLYLWLVDTYTAIGKKHGIETIVYSDKIEDIPNPKDFDKTIQNLVIVDDMITESAKKLQNVSELFSKGRKDNITTMMISQSYTMAPKFLRDQCNYIILKSIRSVTTFKTLISNYSIDYDPKQMYKLYKEATKDMTDFFMIDLGNKDEKMRFRKNYEPILMHSPNTEHISEVTSKKPKKSPKLF